MEARYSVLKRKIRNRLRRDVYLFGSSVAHYGSLQEALRERKAVLCSECEAELLIALTGKQARNLKLLPGVYCPNGHVSLRVSLNPHPDKEIWDPDDPELPGAEPL